MNGKKVSNVSITSTRGRRSTYTELLDLKIIDKNGKGEAMTYPLDDPKAYNRTTQAVFRMNRKHAPMKWIVGKDGEGKNLLVQRVA